MSALEDDMDEEDMEEDEDDLIKKVAWFISFGNELGFFQPKSVQYYNWHAKYWLFECNIETKHLSDVIIKLVVGRNKS